VAARSIASLTVSFGLVAIPVKLYTATQTTGGSIRFNMLHAKDGSRLKQQYVCLKEGLVVERDEIVKGYEFAKDQYVMFSPEEIKALEEVGTKSIDVTDFVPLESVDPVYYDRTYYLAPDKGGAKPYSLFAQALRETGRCAIGRWASHGKDHLVMLRPLEKGLVLQQLHFASEVRSVDEIDIDTVDVREAELKLARQLIEQQASAGFDAAAYKDEVRARIEAEIQKKVEGQEITVAEERPQAGAKVIDLMEALRASLEKGAADRGEPARATTRKPPKKAAKEPKAARKATRR
jgi:DNA end-binding protein Ku